MNVLMLLDAPFPPDVRVEKEITTLIEAGHEVNLLCYRFSPKIDSKDIVHGAKIHRLYLPRQVSNKALGLFFHLPLYVSFWRRNIRKMIELISPDVIHVHDLPLGFPAWKALDQIKNSKPRFLLDLHENYPDLLRTGTVGTAFPQRLFFNYNRWFALEGDLVHRADHVIVVSEENRERLRRDHMLDSPISVVPNYVSLQTFDSVQPDNWTRSFFKKDLLNLLYVGGLDPARGLETILEGLTLIRQSDQEFNFVIVGSGSFETSLRETAKTLGLSDSIQFTGQVSQQRVGEFISCTDVCLLPLKRTIQTDLTDPNKLYQYAYFGKPVLASGTTALKKRVRDLQCGLTYEPDDALSFAQAYRILVQDPGAMTYFAQEGKKQVQERFNWSVAARVLIGVYQQLEAPS